jgi:hypothetical protein
MRALIAALLLIAGALTAMAGEYSLANRVPIVFPGPHGGIVHLSPFPMSKRAASVWHSDACWRDCSAQGGWRMDACLAVENQDSCRAKLDAQDRACLRQCRLAGGPLLDLTDY